MSARRPDVDNATTSHVQDPCDDAPTQPITPTSKELLEERRTRAIKAILGLPEEAIPSWPGLQVVCAHIESCFDALQSTGRGFYWGRMSYTLPKTKVSYEIWDRYLAFFPDDFKVTSDMNARKFAAFCCVSLILKPTFVGYSSIGFENYVSPLAIYSGDSSGDKLLQNIGGSFRIAGFLHTIDHYEDQSPDIERAGIHENTGMVYENTVNFDSLSTIGRLTIRWVDSIANHLVFDQEKHVVYVFRFPTFSDAMIEGKAPSSSGQHW